MSASGNDHSQDGKRGDTTQVKVVAELKLNGYAVLMDRIEEAVFAAAELWAREGRAPKGIRPAHLESLREHMDREISNAVNEILAHE